LMWVDDELESLWLAPCDSPAFSRPALMDPPLDASVTFNTDPEPLTVSRQGSQVSQAAAAQIAAALARITGVLNENEIRLGNLDAVAGDGDHGAGMARGSAAAADAAQALVSQGAGVQTTLAGAGLRWSEQSGGASGALWGAALTAAGNFLGDERAVDSAAVIGAVRAFAGSITSLGGAQVGDKTIVDSLEPFADVLEQSILAGEQLSDAWAKASNAAEKAAADTAHLVPRMGRARVLGNKSVGSPDPGAVSFALAAAAVVDDSTP
jgi:dihydroxyacetone kinase